MPISGEPEIGGPSRNDKKCYGSPEFRIIRIATLPLTGRSPSPKHALACSIALRRPWAVPCDCRREPSGIATCDRSSSLPPRCWSAAATSRAMPTRRWSRLPDRRRRWCRSVEQPRQSSAGQHKMELSSGRDGHFHVDARVDGRHIDFIVDTGASLVIMRETDAAHVGLHPMPRDYTAIVFHRQRAGSRRRPPSSTASRSATLPSSTCRRWCCPTRRCRRTCSASRSCRGCGATNSPTAACCLSNRPNHCHSGTAR